MPERLIAMLDALPPPISATCATGRSCSSASLAGCAARKSSALSAVPRTRSKAPAGPSSSTTACSSPCAAKRPARSRDRPRPVAALKAWLKFARIRRARLLRAMVRREVGSEPLNDRHVARLVKRLALAAGVRGDLSEPRVPLGARRARLVGRGRRTLRPEAPRPRLGGNDPPLPAPPRPLPGQPDQGRGPVNSPKANAPSETARRGWGGSPPQPTAAPRFAVAADNAVAATIAGLASRSSTCGYEGARDSSPLVRARDFRLAFSCAITNGPVANAPCRAFPVNALR